MLDSLTQLDSKLQRAVLDSALSLSEAWLIQDQLLLSTDEWVRFPPHLEGLAMRLNLFLLEEQEGPFLH